MFSSDECVAPLNFPHFQCRCYEIYGLRSRVDGHKRTSGGAFDATTTTIKQQISGCGEYNIDGVDDDDVMTDDECIVRNRFQPPVCIAIFVFANSIRSTIKAPPSS